jgi:hypothetical protein
MEEFEFPSLPKLMLGGAIALLFLVVTMMVCIAIIASITAGQNSLARFFAWLFGRNDEKETPPDDDKRNT